MSFVGNFLWFVLGPGLVAGILYWIFGLLFCCTIVGIPFGIACFRIARFAFFPFGKELVDAEMINEKPVAGSTVMNILWCLFAGIWLAFTFVVLGISLCCTIFGIPFGLAFFKLAKASFSPLGKRVVSSDVALAARVRQANLNLDAKFSEPGKSPNTEKHPETAN